MNAVARPLRHATVSATITAIVALAVCATPSRAVASAVVVVAPFKGPQAAPAEQTVQKALRKYAVVLSPARYALVARGVFAETQSTEDIATVAKEMGAQWVITGTVKSEGGRWSLNISLRDGRDGKSVAKLRYSMPTQRATPSVLHMLGVEIIGAFQAARSRPRATPQEPETGDTPPIAGNAPTRHRPPPPGPGPGDDDEAPPRPGEKRPPPRKPTPPPPEPEPEPPPPPPRRVATPPPPPPEEVATPAPPPPKPAAAPAPTLAPNKRPKWARWFELGIGPSLTGRNFSVDPPPPRFNSSVVGGVMIDLNLYPLAFTWRTAYGLLSGVGLGITLVKPFWPDSTSKSDMTQRFPTDELRIEGGLRYKITLYKPMPRPQLHLLIEGGLHSFTFAKAADGSDVVGVPDVRYVYASIGGGLTVHFAEWSWIWVKFAYHAVTDAGPIQAPDQYGLAATYGLRFSAGLDFLVWRGVRLGVQGMYERFSTVFGYDPANRVKIADGSTDEYYGAMVLLGYVL